MAKQNTWAIEGQFDIFEYMASFPTIEQQKKAESVLSGPVSFSDIKTKILSSAEEYLKKGERLTTLAKERFGEMIKELSFSDVEEKLFNIKVSSYSVSGCLVPKIATTVIRPLLKTLTTCDGDDNSLKMIKSLVDYDVDIKLVDLDGELGYMDRCSATFRLRKKSNKLLKLTLKEEGFRELEVYGLQFNAHTKGDKNVLFKDRSQLGDVAEILAWLVCFTQFNRAMLDDELKPVIEEKLMRNSIGVEGHSEGMIKAVIARNTSPYVWADDYDSIRDLYEDKKTLIGIPLQKTRQPSEASIEMICSMLHVDLDSVRRDIEMSYSTVQGRNKLEIAEKGIPYMYVLTRELDFVFMAIDPINWVRNTGKKLVYSSFLSPCTSVELYDEQNNANYQPITWPEPSVYGGSKGELLSVVGEVLELVFQNYKEKVETLNYLKETKSRAKVYQTKKNIPEKTVKMMQESVLNNYFGYVELDESCDLEKISILTEQFIAFKETYLNKVDTKKVQIRFRKLGNYKAAGLYFPHLGCLCVDVRNPDSFTHEYAHCIDNTIGRSGKNLSDEADFYCCYSAYRRAFNDAVRKSLTAKDVLKGKYNESYYLQKTEAFARCFEMYVSRVLGVQNSICKPDSKMDFAYPFDEKLEAEINKYYKVLFEQLHDNEEETAA
ncbi:hypothetical protein [Pseudobutyrivibrio sp.]|uniref:hypothetical protein n=1 Tax=Pseudobutyrivibrio sp. TaxID=2014367 RepID=UPI0025FD3E1D|nr:hypothetical protein [Pseudobutyrivibrio sp.]